MNNGQRALGKARLQVGAVPVRIAPDGSAEVLLVTTRTTKRWTVPKGWPIKGLKSHEAAAREALEEAGVIGRIKKKAFGRYLYWKRMPDHFQLCKVRTSGQNRTRRQHLWVKPADAADLVDEPGLRTVLRTLAV